MSRNVSLKHKKRIRYTWHYWLKDRLVTVLDYLQDRDYWLCGNKRREQTRRRWADKEIKDG